VAFGTGSFKGAVGGSVDYRLARQSLISEYRKGRLAKHQVCDAHPELVRTAKNCGEPTATQCPICAEVPLVLVSYLFGPGLPPSGKTVMTRSELMRAAKTLTGELACYVVEVCPECSWNHLRQVFPVKGRKKPNLVTP
jgi:hypothetical protein